MSLLNHLNHITAVPTGSTLHSTMSLLNPREKAIVEFLYSTFTFHNVSIKSASGASSANTVDLFTFHNVSIKSGFYSVFVTSTFSFTFHNVSIKSIHASRIFCKISNFTFHNVSIKSRPSSLRSTSLPFYHFLSTPSPLLS